MALNGSTLDSYLEIHPSKRKILAKHYDGISPSAIDRQLGLVKGEARRAINDYWQNDKAMTKRVR